MDDLSEDEIHPNLGPRRHSLRPKFLPHQAGVDARTGVVDRNIGDICLQH